jgi:O-antigen/teichoic acid export membrane protein
MNSTDIASEQELLTVLAEKSSKRPITNLSVFLANAGHGGIRGLVFMANTLVLVPLLLVSLGKEQFAILALVTPFLRYGFNGVFDCGIATGIVRHTSRSFAASDVKDTNTSVSSAFALYLIFGAALVCFYYPVGPRLMPLVIRSNSEFYGSAQIIFGRSVWIYLLFSLSNPFFSVLMGLQKVEATHWIGTASLLIELGGILLLVPIGITVSRVMWVYIANASFSLLLSVCLAWFYFPALRLSWKYVSLGRVNGILKYGAQFSATTFAAMLGPVFDKLILARFVGLSAVAFYEAAARLVDLLRRATQLFLLPLFPMAGAREDTHTESERHHFYGKVFSANLLVSCGLYLVPASLAMAIFRVWLGAGSRLAVIAFLVLCVTTFCLALVAPISMIFAGTGRLRPLMTTALLGLLLNVTMSPILAHYWGFAGVLSGTAIAYGFMSLLFLIWSLGIAEFAVPVGQLLWVGTLTILAGLLPGILLTLVFHLGAQPLGGRKLFFIAGVAFGSFLALSSAQGDYRRMILRVFHQVREGIGLGWSKRKVSNA